MEKFRLIVENINLNNFELALKLCEEDKIKENQYLINNFKGVIFYLQNKFELAEKYFKESHKLNIEFEDPLKNLYIIYIKKKELLRSN